MISVELQLLDGTTEFKKLISLTFLSTPLIMTIIFPMKTSQTKVWNVIENICMNSWFNEHSSQYNNATNYKVFCSSKEFLNKESWESSNFISS